MVNSENPSEVSEFFLACQNGNVEFVKNYLKESSDSKCSANQFEPSVKSTPLHAASYNGHKKIVKLLIEDGCDRSQVNGSGLTAYEVAANDEIRELFNRPSDGSHTRRFQDEDVDDCFDFVKRPKTKVDESAFPADKPKNNATRTATVHGYKTKAEKQREIGYSTTSITMCRSKLGRFMADKFHRDAPMSFKSMGDKLKDLVQKEVNAKKDPQTQKANELLDKFLHDSDVGRIEHLIRLYTLETKFYHALKQSPIPLALPVYMTLDAMKNRHFQGQAYRGAKMDDDDIATYEWAVSNHGSLLQTRHFSSTTLKRSIAEEFATRKSNKGKNIERQSVLFTFNFPQKSEQAIYLGRISDQDPCLSEFENEDEVLLLPWTLFEVDKVEKESSASSSSYNIQLTNVPLPHTSMWSSLKWVLRHPIGSVERFKEHFPEKQPEAVTTALLNNLPIIDKNVAEQTD